MSVFSDASKEEIDASGGDDGFLIILALLGEIRSVTIENVDVACGNVYLVEQIPVHEAVIALRMFLGNSHILIHIKSDHILE